jgi:hypothetical protein
MKYDVINPHSIDALASDLLICQQEFVETQRVLNEEPHRSQQMGELQPEATVAREEFSKVSQKRAELAKMVGELARDFGRYAPEPNAYLLFGTRYFIQVSADLRDIGVACVDPEEIEKYL